MQDSTKLWIKEWVETIIIALVLALVVRVFIVEAYKIPSGSMEPTLKIGDKIFVNKFLYGAKLPFVPVRLPKVRDPKRGDIIVFRYPEDMRKNFVKRLIAFSGETVEIKMGKVYVNDKAIDLEPINSIYYTNGGIFGMEGQKIEVPQDSYFVLGDNSGNSRDSRMWGFVPKENLVGKAMIIWWPIKRISTLK